MANVHGLQSSGSGRPAPSFVTVTKIEGTPDSTLTFTGNNTQPSKEKYREHYIHDFNLLSPELKIAGMALGVASSEVCEQWVRNRKNLCALY